MKRGEVICWVVGDAQSTEFVTRTKTRREARVHAREAGKCYVAGKPKACAFIGCLVKQR